MLRAAAIEMGTGDANGVQCRVGVMALRYIHQHHGQTDKETVRTYHVFPKTLPHQKPWMRVRVMYDSTTYTTVK